MFDKYFPYPYVSNFYWSFDYGPAHFAVLDQYVSYTPGSAQYIWLENDLANTSKEWKFLVFHEPGWSALGGHANNTTVQTYIQPLCLTYGVDVIFAGHNHYYARCEVDGIQHITTGGGGAPLATPDQNAPNLVYAESCYQYCEISIQADQLNFACKRRDGTVADSFTISHVPCTATACYVYDILPSTLKGSAGKSYGQAFVTIKDDGGKPVSNATVTATFTGSFNENVSATSNSNGVATLTTTAQTKKPSYTITVTDVSHATLPYNSSLNIETSDSY